MPPRALPVKQPTAKIAAAVRRLRDLWRRRGELNGTRREGEALTAWAKRKRLKESPDTLYKILEFAKRIPSQQDLDKLLAQSMLTGMPLSWGHFIALMSVTDTTKRLKFAKLAADEGLSATSLRARIQADDPRGNRRAGSGRKPLANAPLGEAVLRIRRQIGILRRQLEALPTVGGIDKGQGSQILAKRQAVLLAALAEFDEEAKKHGCGKPRAVAR